MSAPTSLRRSRIELQTLARIRHRDSQTLEIASVNPLRRGLNACSVAAPEDTAMATTTTTTTSTCEDCGDDLAHGDGLCDACRAEMHERAFGGGAR